jgi:hypothetical protein
MPGSGFDRCYCGEMIKLGTYAKTLLVCAALLSAACRKSTQSSGEAHSLSRETKLDACALITKDEIATIQGSPVMEAKSSVQVGNSFRSAQCFYTAKEFSRSVVLTVTQRDWEHPITQTPNDFWNETFHSEGNGEKEQSEREEGEKATPPRKVDGVGDEAYWTGARFGGALYVLKKDVFLRISVGGSDTEQGKIDKSKALALKALNRL